MDKKILISTTTFAEFNSFPFEMLKSKGFAYILNPYRRELKPGEVINLGKDVVGIIAGTEKLSEDVFSQLPNLKVISRCGVGMDNIDLETARKREIKVYNTPDAPTLAVAELTIGLILNLLRKVNQMERVVRNGGWNKMMGNLLYGKKVGIIGFGRIGQKVAQLLSGFSVELSYYDIEYKRCPVKCDRKEFKEIIGWADIITLHLSLPRGSSPIIGSSELNKMKKGSWLVNISRGGVVDEKALYCVLKEGHLGAAALDVFSQEPYLGALRELDNVLFTPHVGSYAKEARIRMEIQATENLLTGLIES